MFIPIPLLVLLLVLLFAAAVGAVAALVGRHKRIKRVAELWSELCGPMMDVDLVRPWQGPHNAMPGELIDAVRKCGDRLVRTRFDGLDALEQFAVQLTNAANQVMAAPGAHDLPPSPEQLARLNLESFGPDAVVDRLEQFLGRYVANQLELKEDHPFTALDCQGGMIVMDLIEALIRARTAGRRVMIYQRSLDGLEPWASISERMPDHPFQTRGGLGTNPEQAESLFGSDELLFARRETEGYRDLAAEEAKTARRDLMAALEKFTRLYKLPAEED